MTNNMDDGTCQADTMLDHYYAAAPQLESMAEPPLGSPKLPPGRYLGCLNTNQFNASCTKQGNVCQPPYGNSNSWDTDGCFAAYTVQAYALPWIDYGNKLGCVCADGRFSESYERNDGIVCNEGWQFVLPP